MTERMNIPLDEKTRITSDAHNFIIQKFKGHDKEGKEVWSGEKFYTTIGGLLDGLHQQKLRGTACVSLEGLAKAIDASLAYLEELKAQITPIGGI